MAYLLVTGTDWSRRPEYGSSFPSWSCGLARAWFDRSSFLMHVWHERYEHERPGWLVLTRSVYLSQHRAPG